MAVKIGFVGVGTMGEPMASNLLKAGYDLTVVAHRARASVERLVSLGAQEATSVAAMAAETEVIIVCVSNDAAVEQVLLGPNGVRAGGHKGLLVIDTSTISPSTSRRLAAALADNDITMLDAPISGGQAGAIAGTLAIMVGGPRASFEEIRPVLEAMGSNITYIGENGSALAVKLANNLIVAAQMVAISEALTMAAKAGVDPGLVQQVLVNATASSRILQTKVPQSILTGNLQPGFKLALMHKDMGLALDFGKELGIPMFISGLVHQLYTQALGLGKGERDSIAISELYTESTGVSLRRRD